MGVSENVFCAFCRVPRKAYLKKHVTWINVLLSALFSLMVMLVSWHGFESKVFIIFVFALAGAEVFIQIRWRLSVVCPHCGFDPIMYVKDRRGLVNKVKERLEHVKTSPVYMLSQSNPYRNLAQLVKPTRKPLLGNPDIPQLERRPEAPSNEVTTI